jgi:hypothetical protein
MPVLVTGSRQGDVISPPPSYNRRCHRTTLDTIWCIIVLFGESDTPNKHLCISLVYQTHHQNTCVSGW